MTAPAPKVGDRVLCRHGESKLVGELTSISAITSVMAVDIGGCQQTLRWADWIVDVLRPPVPDVEGTIVRDRNRIAWQRFPRGWHAAGGLSFWPLRDLVEALGPLEVLYTPMAP